MKYKKENIIIVLSCLFIIILLLQNKESSDYHFQEYTVQLGDTAWKIMSKNNFANKDIRKFIYYIEKDNGIKPGYLFPGQEIKIRIYETR